jgi:hypothetical protein
VAPTVTSVSINDESRSAVSSFIPAPGKVVVVSDTFTVAWADSDVLTAGYELQWDGGTGNWTTITAVPASERPTSLITQEMDQFATPETVKVLAAAADRDAQYLFRVRAVNDAGASRWSSTFVLNGQLVGATPSARVTKHAGPTNGLAVTVTESFSNGLAVATTEEFSIRNNTAGTYDVGSHEVYVDTSGSTKIREIRIVE